MKLLAAEYAIGVLSQLAVLVLLSVPVCAQIPINNSAQADDAATESTSYLQQPIDSRRELGNVPDDIGYQLQEAEDQIDAIFPVGPLTPLHKIWNSLNSRLKETTRLDLGLNYTAIYQRAETTVRGPRDAGDGDLDFFGRWLLLGDEDYWPGALVFSSETRHRPFIRAAMRGFVSRTRRAAEVYEFAQQPTQ